MLCYFLLIQWSKHLQNKLIEYFWEKSIKMFFLKGSGVNPGTKMKWAQEQRAWTQPSRIFLPGLLMLTASSPTYGSKSLSPFCVWRLSLPAWTWLPWASVLFILSAPVCPLASPSLTVPNLAHCVYIASAQWELSRTLLWSQFDRHGKWGQRDDQAHMGSKWRRRSWL